VLLWLVLLGAALSTATASVARRGGTSTSAAANQRAPWATAASALPRFHAAVMKAAAGASEGSGVSSSGHSSAGARTASAGASGAGVKGGEWWVKDVPWFLPPPPEWGPLPPTMYTSYYHRPRYPTLSTANYYPLYSKTDEYDAHLPASMSRRATLTQQMVYDNYVTNYYAHTHYSPTGNPNLLITNPSMYGNSAAMGGLGEAHARVLASQSTNNYFPLFSRTHDFYTSPGQTFSPHFWSTTVSFLEGNSHLHRDSDSRQPAASASSSATDDEYGVPPPPMFPPPASYTLVGTSAVTVRPRSAASAFTELESSGSTSTTRFLSSSQVRFKPRTDADEEADE